MNTVLLITITYGALEQYNLVAKNEPSKVQLLGLLQRHARGLEKEAVVVFEKFNHVGGDHKVYHFLLDDRPLIAEVRRMQLVEFEKGREGGDLHI